MRSIVVLAPLAVVLVTSSLAGCLPTARPGDGTPTPAKPSGPSLAPSSPAMSPATEQPASAPASDMPTATPTTEPSAGAPPNALAGFRWYVDPGSNAARQALAWKNADPSAARALEQIADQPQADWFTSPDADIRAVVATRVATIRTAGADPLLVAYAIPRRDCGSYSAGGAASGAAYREWIREFSRGIGSGPAVVILEPDALAGLDCLSAAEQAARFDLLRDAVEVLEAQRGTRVYLDAGHSAWQPASVMAERLRRAGVAESDGFSLNVSNFGRTADEVAYGREIATALGGAHFVVDTSRNGQGPAADGAWCNPPGRGLGQQPTTSTGVAGVDAYLWIKRPGESDGTCNGGPSAGTWWPQYAVGLAERASR